MNKRRLFFTIKRIFIGLIICSAVVYIALQVRITGITDSNKKNDEKVSEQKTGERIDTPQPLVDSWTDPMESGNEALYNPENEDDVEYNVGEFLCKDIYIDGYLINNWELYDPFVTIEDKVFIPMSIPIQKALGISVGLDKSVKNITCSPAVKSSGHIKDAANACNVQYVEVIWDREYSLGAAFSKNIAAISKLENAQGKKAFYVSAESFKSYAPVYFDYYADDFGLYISTEKGVSAQSLHCLENSLYEEGRARYMCKLNKKLKYKDALLYEYLFRHEAGVYGIEDPDILIGMCRYESNFNNDIGKQAIGLMQILYKYAEKNDYSKEMLEDPHYNIEYGADNLASCLKSTNGDLKRSLASYNAGLGAINKQIRETGTYRQGYANKCINYKDVLKSWIVENNYSNTYLTYTK